MNREKTLIKKVTWRLQDLALQWLWFAFNIKKEYIGYDKGLLTWLRTRRHRKLKRPIHICLLEVYPRGGKFGRFTAFWINERSLVCSVSINEYIENADILWVFSQDPLTENIKKELLQTIKKARPGTPVINHPDVYNSYHEEYTFRALKEAGVNVPRFEFTENDIGKAHVLYKLIWEHGSPKFLSLYRGPVKGHRPFEFIDSRGSDGLFRKYRAFYINGLVYHPYLLLSDHWDVRWATKKQVKYTFEIPADEIASLHLIAKTLKIQYFSVDYMRRNSDGRPFFTDINVYPMPIAYAEIARHLGYYGRWHLFDNRLRLEIPEFSGRSFWDMFDEAIVAFAHKESFHKRHRGTKNRDTLCNINSVARSTSRETTNDIS